MSDSELKIFKEVFLQFHPELKAFGKKIISNTFIIEEAIQELFIYIYEKDINLSSIKNLKAYLFVAFRRRILSKKQSIQFNDNATDLQFLSTDFNKENERQLRNNKQLSEMLNNLPWSQREAIYLKYFNKLSSKEIAGIMGIKPQVVSNTIYKALKKMKDIASAIALSLTLICV